MRNYRKQNSKIEKYLFLSLAAAFMFFQVACSKSSNGGAGGVVTPIRPVLPVGASPNCPNCFGSPAMLVATDSSSGWGSVLLSLDFYGDISSGVSFQNPKAPLIYQGPVQAIGVFTVQSQDAMSCGAPVGQYDVQTVQAGQWSQGVVGGGGSSGYGPSGMKLVAIGPGGIQIFISLVQGIIYNGTSPIGTSNQTVNRLGGTMTIDAIQNTPCGSNVSLK